KQALEQDIIKVKEESNHIKFQLTQKDNEFTQKHQLQNKVINELKTKQVDDQKIISKLKKKIEEQTQDSDKLKEKVLDIVKEAANTQELLNSNKNKLQKLTKENQELDKKQRDNKEEISKLKNDILTKDQELNKANENFNVLTNKVSSIENELKSKTENIQTIIKEKEQLNNTLNENRKNLENSNTEINKLKETINTNEQTQLNLQKQIEQNIEEFKNTLKEKEQQINKLKSQAEKTIQEREELTKKISNLEKEIEDRNTSITKNNNEINSLKLKVTELTESDEQLKQEYNEKIVALNKTNNEFKEQQQLDKETISKLEKDIVEKTDLIAQLQKKLNNGFTQLQVEESSKFEVINNKISENISKKNDNLNPKDKKDFEIDNISEQAVKTNKLIVGIENFSLLSNSKPDTNLDESLKIQQYSVEILSPTITRNAIAQATDGIDKSTHQQNGSKKFIDWNNILELIKAIGATTTVQDNKTALENCKKNQQIDFTKENSKFTLSQNKTTNAITLESQQTSFDHFIDTLSKLIDEQRKLEPNKTIHITFKKIPNLSEKEYAEALQKLPHHKNIEINYQGDDNSAFTNALAQNQGKSNNVFSAFHNERKRNEEKHDTSPFQGKK
ncbi:hypothetical protein, partial [Cysteiniphilum sp. 5D8B4]